MQQLALNTRNQSFTPANMYVKKMCFKRCNNCKGPKCPNYYGYISNKKDYYSAVLHSKKIKFNEDILNQKQPMNKFDKQLVGGFIVLTVFLTIFGGLLL